MLDVHVIDAPDIAASALAPLRGRLLAELGEPASAATLAARLGMPRQKVNYHLRELEEQGLVTEASARRWGGLTERLMVASAAAYVISPAALGDIQPDPRKAPNRLSVGYAVALAARALRELGSLWQGADHAGRPLPVLALDADIRFASPADRASFAVELTEAVTRLTAKYHNESAPGGRWHRMTVLAHPRPVVEHTNTHEGG